MAFLDDFNRTGNLTTPWQALGTKAFGWTTDGARAVPNGVPSNYAVVPTTADGYVQATLAVATTGANTTSLVFRGVDQDNFWIWVSDGRLFKVVASVFTEVLPSGGSRSFGSGDVLRAEYSGNQITLKRAGVVCGTATDAAHATTGIYAGFLANNGEPRWDDFSTGEPVVSPVTTVEGPTATTVVAAPEGVVAATDNSYPGYDTGYGGDGALSVVPGAVAAITATAPVGVVSLPVAVPGEVAPVVLTGVAGDVTAKKTVLAPPATLVLSAPVGNVPNTAVAGPRTALTVTAPLGAFSVGVTLAGPPATDVYTGLEAHVGAVSASSTVPIDIVLEGPLATVLYAAPTGTLATGTGSGISMPQGQVIRLTVTAPVGGVSIGPYVFDPDVTLTGSVEGVVARVTLAAPPGVLVTGPPNLAGPMTRVTVRAPVGEVSAYAVIRTDDVLTLTLLTTDVAVQPGVLRLAISNGTPGVPVYFFLDAGATSVANTVLDDNGGAILDLPINGLAVGGHTVRIGTTITLPTLDAYNQRSFTVTGAPAPTPVVVVPQVPPVPEPQVNRWVFQAYDFSSLSNVFTYALPINPNRIEQGFGDFQIASEPTVVSSGTVVSWEGAPVPVLWRWGGDVLTKEDHAAMLALGVTGQRLYVTDHYGRRYLVKIASLSFQRVRDRARPWHHTYEMSAWALSGEGVYV